MILEEIALSQKYATNKKPFQSTIVDKRLWVCCVDSKGNRKKDYPRRAEAEAVIRELGGVARSYRCIFNPDMFHITTRKTKPKKLDAVTCGYILASLKYRQDKVEAALQTLKEKVEGMTSETPLEEIRQASSNWNNLSQEKTHLPAKIKHFESLL